MIAKTEFNLIPKYINPIETGNKYQFILAINDTQVKQHFIQYDDRENGIENTRRLEINNDDLWVEPVDVATIKMQCIDALVSSYYTALAKMGGSGPRGGTTPNNPPTNLSNGALGVFSTQTFEIKSVQIE